MGALQASFFTHEVEDKTERDRDVRNSRAGKPDASDWCERLKVCVTGERSGTDATQISPEAYSGTRGR